MFCPKCWTLTSHYTQSPELDLQSNVNSTGKSGTSPVSVQIQSKSTSVNANFKRFLCWPSELYIYIYMELTVLTELGTWERKVAKVVLKCCEGPIWVFQIHIYAFAIIIHILFNQRDILTNDLHLSCMKLTYPERISL